MKKKLCLFLVVFIIFSNPFFYNGYYAYAESAKSEFEIELEENVEQRLDDLDFSELEQIYQNVAGDNAIFKNGSFYSKVKDLISGNLNIDANSFTSYLGSLFLDDILSFLPSICLIIAISVLYSMLSGLNSGKNKGMGDVIHFVCYGSVVIIVVTTLFGVINLTTGAIGSLKTQMNAVFPVLLTLLAALGGTTSVSVYQPAMAVLSSTVVNVFTGILLPIFTFKLVFTILSNLTSGIKFNKFAEFFGSVFKWIIGIILTIFTAFVSIQGLMAGGVDGISIRTAKYTIKSSVPLIGGFISDGMGLILISSSLIKNAVGVGGLILLFCTVFMPIIKIIVFSLLMKLASAILEPIADDRITSFVNQMSKSISLLITLLLGVAFMYFIIIGLVMCSANLF